MTIRFFKTACITAGISFCKVAIAQANIEYDIVLIGGRVIDPETKLLARLLCRPGQQYFWNF